MPHIGRYELDKIIGRGRFGRVYKGINSDNGEFVAVKLEDRRNESKLLEEAETIQNIRKNYYPLYPAGKKERKILPRKRCYLGSTIS